MVKKTLSKTVKHAEGNIYSLICKGAASTGLKKSVPLNVDLNYSLPDILPPKRRKIDAATKPTASLHNNDANDSCDSTESVEFSSCQPKSSPVNNNIGRSILPATYFDSDTNSPNLENNCSRQSLEHLLKTSDSSISTCSDSMQDHTAPKKRGRPKKINSIEKENFDSSPSSSNLHNCTAELVERSVATSVKYRSRTRKLCNQTSQIPSKCESTCVLSSDKPESKLEISRSETKFVSDGDELPDILPPTRHRNVGRSLIKTKKQRAVANLVFSTSDSESTHSSAKCIATCSDGKQDHAAPKKRGRPKKIKNSSYEKETFGDSASSSNLDNCSREISKPKSTCVLSTDESESKVKIAINETKLVTDCDRLPNMLPSSRRQNVRYNLSKTKKQRAVANLGFPTSDSESTQSSVKCIAACSDSKQDHAAPKKRGRPKKIKNSSYEKETFDSSAISSISDNCSRELVESSISETKLTADCEELPDILPPTRPQNIGRNFTKTKKQLTAVNLSFPTSDSEHTHSSAKCINDDDSLRCQQKVSESSSASHDGNSILDRSSVNDLLQRTTVDSPISIDSEEDFPQPMLSPRKKIVLKTRFPKPRAVKKAPVRSGALFGEKSFKSKASSSGCKTVSKTADNNDDLVYSSSSIVPYTPVSNTTMELDTSDELPDLNDTGSPQSTEVGLNKTGMWEKIFGDGSWKTGKSSSTTCEKAVKTTKGKCTRKSAVTNVDAKRPKAAKSKSLSLKKGNKTRKYGESSILHHLILNKSADVQNTGQTDASDIVTCEYKEVKVKTRAEISKMFELPKVEYTYEEPEIVLDSRLKEFKRIFSKVDENDIKQKIEANLPYLRRVSDGRVKTWRHGQYTKSGRDRRNLDYQYPMYLLSETQQDAIYLGILKMYCNEKNGMEYFDYLMRVLIPEFIVKVFMDICSLSHDVADTLIRKQDSHMAWADYVVPE